MGIDPTRLGPAAQRQIAEKLLENSRSRAAITAVDAHKPSKMKNIPTYRITDSGQKIRFASQKEAARYDDLMLMLKAGKIRNLRLQPEYTLQEAYTTPDGERVLAIRYRADFSYEKKEIYERDYYRAYEESWNPVVEDVKGHRTDVYKMKKKMMLERYGIEIQEV